MVNDARCELQRRGRRRLSRAADYRSVQVGRDVALFQPVFANFEVTKQSLTDDGYQPEAAITLWTAAVQLEQSVELARSQPKSRRPH